ncbi:MAG: hypothetical protein HYX60_02740 [Legionella longbeachae]|nr:hypothetical protein [Legionella longbeachae]
MKKRILISLLLFAWDLAYSSELSNQLFNKADSAPKSQSQNTSSILRLLWGETPENSVQVGGAVLHPWPTQVGYLIYRPYLGLTYKSLYLTYFKSCSYDNGYGIALQRNIYKKDFNERQLSIGYRAGVVYGWCLFSNPIDVTTPDNERCHVPVLPSMQLVINYRYKNIGLELATMGLTTLSVSYHF